MNNDRLARFILSPLVLRVVWQVDTGLFTCMLFWIAAVRFGVREVLQTNRQSSRILARVSLVGLLCNAVVTIANGGYMPVVGDGITNLSVWVTSTEATRLLWLADHTDWWGFSIGDGLVIGGWLARLSLWVVRGLGDALQGDMTRDARNVVRLERITERRMVRP